MSTLQNFERWSPDCPPQCQPDCGPGGETKPQQNPSQVPRKNSKSVTIAENLVLVMFVVGVSSQVFSFLLYAFANTA